MQKAEEADAALHVSPESPINIFRQNRAERQRQKKQRQKNNYRIFHCLF